MFIVKDLAVGIASILLGVFIYLQGKGLTAKTSLDPAGPAALPMMMAYAIIFLGIVHVLGGLYARKITKNDNPSPTFAEKFRKFLDRYHLVMVVFLIGVAYYFLLNVLGYPIATPLLFAGILWALGKRDLKSLLLTNLILTTILFVVFRFGLSVDLPLGPFETLF